MSSSVIISIIGVFVGFLSIIVGISIQIYYHHKDSHTQDKQLGYLRKIAYNSSLENALLKERNIVG